MNRSTLYSQEQARSFDLLWIAKDAMEGIAWLSQDLLGATYTSVAGLTATPTGPASLTINLSAGRIYQQAVVDATSWGSLAADNTIITQQGAALPQQVTLSTAALSSGQSQYVLVQATFSQTDVIRANDPTGGLLYYYNSANPSTPFQGPGGLGTTQPTERQASIAISVVAGTPATTGSETPPSASAGNVGLYLIDLTFGQTTISSGQILVAGPSAGLNVPSNYPQAPFIRGLLTPNPLDSFSHHLGIPGHAPKINLGSEVQGTLPSTSLPLITSRSQTGSTYTYQASDNNLQVRRSNSGTAMTDTLPGTSPGFLASGTHFWVGNYDATATLTLTAGTGASLDGTAGGSVSIPIGQRAHILSTGSGNYYTLVITSIAAQPILTTNVDYYVATTGSDSNNGTSAGTPWQTLTKAATVISQLNTNGFQITVHVAAGTYTQAFALNRGIFGGGTVLLVATNGTPTNTVINVTSVPCVQISGTGTLTVNGFQFISNSGAGPVRTGLNCSHGGSILFQNCDFNACADGQISCSNGGTITATGNYTISAGGAAHYFSLVNGQIHIDGVLITISGTPNYTVAFAECTQSSSLEVAGGSAFAGTGATGTRYLAQWGGTIYTAGAGPNYFPGNAPGDSSTGYYA